MPMGLHSIYVADLPRLHLHAQEHTEKQRTEQIRWIQEGFKVRYFRNPYGTPRPTEPQNPPAARKKKEIPKTPKTPIIPARSPKVNARSLKVNCTCVRKSTQKQRTD